MKLKEYMKLRGNEIEDALNNIFKQKYNDCRDKFTEMLIYPIKAGGKRIRPLLTLLACEIFDKDYRKAIKPACSFELVHTYSLVHDDLPDMDNDAMRRGLPTTHVKYGTANAILTGDGLLTHAFQMLATSEVDDLLLRRLFYELSYAAGVEGMVLGQYMDLYCESKEINFELLKIIHSRKTGAMIRGCIRAGAIIGHANEDELEIITKYGELIGLAFQIQDDILDHIADEKKIGKTIGKDSKSDKLTYVKLFTLSGAKEQAAKTVDEAIKTISVLSNKNKEIIDIMIELAKYIIERMR